MRICFGWVPNLSGNCLSDSLSIESAIKNHEGCICGGPREYGWEKTLSDIGCSKTPTPCLIRYKTHDISPNIITATILNDTTPLLDAMIYVHDERGFVQLCTESAGEDIDTLLKQLYIDFKCVLHKHTHHSNDPDGPDTLLELVFTDNFIEATKGISEQYVKKILNYPKIIEGIADELLKRHSNPRSPKYYEKLQEQFHKMYMQALGEFLYGSCFIEMFFEELGTSYVAHKSALSNGTEPIHATIESWSIKDGTKVNESLTKLTIETKALTKNITILTAIVVLLTAITAIVGIVSLYHDIHPSIPEEAFMIVLVIVILLIILFTLYFIRSRLFQDEENSKK